MIYSYDPRFTASDGPVQVDLARIFIQSGTAPPMDSGGYSVTLATARAKLHLGVVYIPELGRAIVEMIKEMDATGRYAKRDVHITTCLHVHAATYRASSDGQPWMVIRMDKWVGRKTITYKLLLSKDEWRPLARCLATLVGSHQFREAAQSAQRLRAGSAKAMMTRATERRRAKTEVAKELADQRKLLKRSILKHVR